MSTETKELIQIREQLPENQRKEVADFVRFLLARRDDERWEETINSSQPIPKLDAFIREAASKESKPMDFDRL